jgi:drug/metabolite transporter superfamily protein YnfA
MTGALPFLVLAAALEIVGDATIRYGLTRSTTAWLIVGGTLLVAYGLVVNANRSVDFGSLMGVYIAVFFVVSQVVAWALLAERPSAVGMIGGALIVAGGLVIHLGSMKPD